MQQLLHKKIQAFKKQSASSRGVALLFVVLLTSVLFVVAIGVSNISYKELVFSLEARNSDLAFFAADTGVECGLYLFKNNFAISTNPASETLPNSTHNFTCKNLTITLPGAIGSINHFALPLGSECVDVTLDRSAVVTDPASGLPLMPLRYYTIITARGYNTPIYSPGATNCLSGTGVTPVNLVSRVLQVTVLPSET